ncbi:hypothetical protein M758_2G073700 [Ceratodon purpureus]|nr:hypothetical protein M758_2G073700 [Ceratodon purpureus]
MTTQRTNRLASSLHTTGINSQTCRNLLPIENSAPSSTMHVIMLDLTTALEEA